MDAKARQILSAFATDTALVLAHIEIDEKSNEIPAVQKLLEELDVAGHIVTLDAMHCQKKNIRNCRRSAGASDRSIKRQPADLVPQGRSRLQRHQAAFRRQTVDSKKRNRHETRTVAVFDALPAVAGTEWEPYVAAIIAIERSGLTFPTRHRLLEAFTPKAPSICPIAHCLAAQAADAIRKHWGIENKQHYTRDVTLREDASRIRAQPGYLRPDYAASLTISCASIKSDTITQDRYAAALGGLTFLSSMNYYKSVEQPVLPAGYGTK